MWIYYGTLSLSVSLTDQREKPWGSGRQNDSNNIVMYNESSNGGQGDLVVKALSLAG